MKNKLPALIILSCLLLTSCGTGEPEMPTPEADRVYDESFREGETEFLHTMVTVPSLSGEGRGEAIDGALEELFEHEKSTAASYRPVALDSYNFAEENYMDFPGCEYEFTASFARFDERCIALEGSAYINLGGVHPDYQLSALNFDRNGDKINIEDIFDASHDEYMGRIGELVSERIEEEEGWYYENWREILMDSWMIDDFIIGEEGLTVFWQTYAIAPYASGNPTFELEWSLLEDLLAEEWK